MITTLMNNNVKPWCVCSRWITKTIVGSIYFWKWIICLQIDECYFIMFLFIQLNWWLKPSINLVLLSLTAIENDLFVSVLFVICLRRFSILLLLLLLHTFITLYCHPTCLAKLEWIWSARKCTISNRPQLLIEWRT